MKLPFFGIAVIGLALFSGCSSGDQEMESSAAAATTDCPSAEVPTGADRRAIMAAIHVTLDPQLSPDGKGPGQPNEYIVSHVRSDGENAFVMGMIRGKNGAKIDFKQTIFADEIREGIFDGPHFEALLEKKNGAWRVVERDGFPTAGIGSTDVWWDGLWESAKVSKALFPVELACRDANTDDRSDRGPVQNPTFGTPERAALMSAIHAVHDKDVRQPNKYVVSWLQSDGTFAFMMGQVVTPDGKQPNWKASAFASELAEGIFDGGHIEALLKKEGGTWRVVENASSIGSTDVWWSGIWESTGAPRALFPSFGD